MHEMVTFTAYWGRWKAVCSQTHLAGAQVILWASGSYSPPTGHCGHITGFKTTVEMILDYRPVDLRKLLALTAFEGHRRENSKAPEQEKKKIEHRAYRKVLKDSHRKCFQCTQ